MDLVLLQKQLDSDKKASLGAASLRTAILVPNTRIAYLSRIAFGHVGEANYRVFYNDLSTALKWLESAGTRVASRARRRGVSTLTAPTPTASAARLSSPVESRRMLLPCRRKPDC